MVLDHERDHGSRWAAVVSISAKIGCAAQTLHEWVKKAERDSGVRAGVPTEVAERHEEKLLMLGPVLERMHNEILDPLIEMTFSRMVEAGIVPPPPDELQGMELNVEFVSMLAQAQRAIATNSVDRFVGNLGAMAGIKPEVLDKFDADRWADAYADMLGIDPELIVPGEQVALIRKQRAEAADAKLKALPASLGTEKAKLEAKVAELQAASAPAKDVEAAARIRQELTDRPPNPRARFVKMKISPTGFQVTRS